MILAINSAATGPARISRPKKTLPSLAPNCNPSRVVRMSSVCRAMNTINDGAGWGARLAMETESLILDDHHFGTPAASRSRLSFVI